MIKVPLEFTFALSGRTCNLLHGPGVYRERLARMARSNGTQKSSSQVVVHHPEKLALETEARKATDLLKGKVVSKVRRYRRKEVCIEFSDGTWLFVDHGKEGLMLSATKGKDDAPSC